MRKATIARLLLFSALLLSLMVMPQPAYAYPMCSEVMSCADYATLCASWSGSASFTWLTICQDEYYYFWDYQRGNCTTGPSMDCWGYAW